MKVCGLIQILLVLIALIPLHNFADCESKTMIGSGDWKGKAGGYAIQGKAAQFIKKISGSYSNIVGLDIYTTANLLRGCGLNVG